MDREFEMARECPFTGKKTVFGRSVTMRGKAKYLGGVGRKTTGSALRKFKPNIQKVRALVDGRIVRLKLSTKAMRMGFVTKPLKRERPEE
jgi:large subunit ribosomal protein L28